MPKKYTIIYFNTSYFSSITFYYIVLIFKQIHKFRGYLFINSNREDGKYALSEFVLSYSEKQVCLILITIFKMIFLRFSNIISLFMLIPPITISYIYTHYHNFLFRLFYKFK